MRKRNVLRPVFLAITLSELLMGCARKPVDMSWLNELPRRNCPYNHVAVEITPKNNNLWYALRAATPENLSDSQVAAAISRAKLSDPTTRELINIPNPLQPGTACINTEGIGDSIEP